MRILQATLLGFFCSSMAFGQYVHTEMLIWRNGQCYPYPINITDSVTFDLDTLKLWTSIYELQQDTLLSYYMPPLFSVSEVDSITYTANHIDSGPGSGVTDIDGNTYGTTVIGNGQEWMTENLRTTRYANGDLIENITDLSAFNNSTVGAWCHFNNDIAYDNTYGKLYNYYAASDVRNACPSGWHVPDTSDFYNLFRYISMDNCRQEQPGPGGIWAINNAEALITSESIWDQGSGGTFSAQYATNATGFSAISTGILVSSGFSSGVSYYWSATTNSFGDPLMMQLQHVWLQYGSLVANTNYFSFGSPPSTGCSIRCIKD